MNRRRKCVLLVASLAPAASGPYAVGKSLEAAPKGDLLQRQVSTHAN